MTTRTPPRNILVIQLGDIGDVVLSTPTFRAFRETYPDARVSVLVRRGYGSLLTGDPHLFEVLEVTKPEETAGTIRRLLATEWLPEVARFITANPFSRWKYKEWGYGKRMEVLDWIRDRYGLPALVVGTKEEAEEAIRIVGRLHAGSPQRCGEDHLGRTRGLPLPEHPPSRSGQRRAAHRHRRRNADGHDLRSVGLAGLDDLGRDAP